MFGLGEFGLQLNLRHRLPKPSIYYVIELVVWNHDEGPSFSDSSEPPVFL